MSKPGSSSDSNSDLDKATRFIPLEPEVESLDRRDKDVADCSRALEDLKLADQRQENLIHESSNEQKSSTSSTAKHSGKHVVKNRPGTIGGYLGNCYEIDLLCLGILRGHRDTTKFYLFTNVNELGAFDDVVMRYWKNGGEKEKSTVIFLQAKTENSKKVMLQNFINPKHDKFYLGKYFLDFLSIKERFSDKSKDPIFKGNFQDLDPKYVIYTNAILDERFDINRKIDIDNIIFSTKSRKDEGRAFKFSLGDNNSDLAAMLGSLACQKRIKLLAKAIVSSISGELSYKNMMINIFFSTYHVFVAKNVIDVGKEIEKDEKKNEYREGKIYHNFLNTDTKDLFKKVLKEEVLYEYAQNVVFNEKCNSKLDDCERDFLVNKVVESFKSSKEFDENVIKKFDEDVLKKLRGNVIILDEKNKQLKFIDQKRIKDESAKQLIEDLKSKITSLADYKFNIPYEFVKKILKEQSEKEPLKLHVSFGNISPSFKKPEHFIKKLIELFEKYKTSKVIKIDNNSVHEKILTDGDIKSIGKLVGNVLIFDEEEKMLRLVDEGSFEDTQKLITDLKNTAQSKDLEVFSYRFDINVKNFPKLKFVTDDEDRTNAEKLLGKLEVFTGQANDEELREIIKDEIRHWFQLREEEADDNFLKIRNEVENLYIRNKYYLEKDDFFSNIVRYSIAFNIINPSDLFFGRETELTDLHKKIQRNSEEATETSRILSISGLGGMGKTQLARRYAYDYKNDYYNGNVIWINAESYQTLVKSFRRLANDKLSLYKKDAEHTRGKEKDIESIVEDVYEFFSKRKSLFIFDNAENLKNQIDGDDGINRFISPRLSNANIPYVLITSRNVNWGKIEVLSLGPFTLEAAMKFVEKGLEIENDSQKSEIQKLIEELQCFPLALAHAIAYIKQADKELKNIYPEREYNINNYIEEYEKKKKELLDFSFPDDSNDTYTKTTFTTWNITIDKIKEKEYGEKALEILDIIAYCTSDNIPAKIFLELGKHDGRKLGATIQLLKQYSMINLESGMVSVHRLVQEVTRIKINLKDREKEVLKKALTLFPSNCSEVDLFADDLRLNNVDQAISVWNYANRHKELMRGFSSLPVLIVSELKASLRYQEAYLFGRNALMLLEKILNDNHPSVLSMMKNVASVLYDQGKYNDSLKYYRKLKEKSGATAGMYLIDTPIGLILNRLGKHDEALQIFYKQYDLVNAGKVISDGTVEHNLGFTLCELNRVDDAEKMFKKALELKEKAFGPDHRVTLNTKHSLTIVLEEQGKCEDALTLAWEVYLGRKKMLGQSHPGTLTTYSNISHLLTELGSYDEALKIANEADEEREKLIPNHPRTLKGKYRIVRILGLQGKYDEALEKCKKVYEKRKEILGLKHEDTSCTLNFWFHLALRLIDHGKYDNALKELQYVLKERKQIFASNHQSIVQIENMISRVHRIQQNGADVIDVKMYDAARDGKLDVINDLLSKGFTADFGVSLKGQDTRFTPLQTAAHEGHKEIVDVLLLNGANVNLADAAGWTALHYAAKEGHLHIADRLLKGGADVNTINNDGTAPLHLAADRGFENIVKILLKRKDINVNIEGNCMLTPLHCAVQNGNAQNIKLLLENGAKIEATAVNGWTSLHVAAYKDHLGAVIALLNRGANINAVSQDNREPLHYTTNDLINKVLKSTQGLFNAVRTKQNESKIQQLLGNGASVNAVSGTDRLTVLHFAVSNGDSTVIKALLKKKPNIDAVDEDDWTPLHYAAQDGHLDIVKLLLGHQANPSALNRDGKTPLDLAGEKLSYNPKIYREIIIVLECKLSQKK